VSADCLILQEPASARDVETMGLNFEQLSDDCDAATFHFGHSVRLMQRVKCVRGRKMGAKSDEQ